MSDDRSGFGKDDAVSDDTKMLNRTIKSVTHQLSDVAEKLDEIVCLLQGKLGETGMVHEVRVLQCFKKELEKEKIWDRLKSMATISKAAWVVGAAVAAQIAVIVGALIIGKISIVF